MRENNSEYHLALGYGVYVLRKKRIPCISRKILHEKKYNVFSVLCMKLSFVYEWYSIVDWEEIE